MKLLICCSACVLMLLGSCLETPPVNDEAVPGFSEKNANTRSCVSKIRNGNKVTLTLKEKKGIVIVTRVEEANNDGTSARLYYFDTPVPEIIGSTMKFTFDEGSYWFIPFDDARPISMISSGATKCFVCGCCGNEKNNTSENCMLEIWQNAKECNPMPGCHTSDCGIDEISCSGGEVINNPHEGVIIKAIAVASQY